MTFDDVIVWAAGLATLISLATTIWNFVASGSRANAKRIEDQDQRLNRHEARLSSVEQDIRNLPAQGDLHQVQLALERMHGDLKEMRAIMGRMESIVSRHEEHLLDGSKR